MIVAGLVMALLGFVIAVSGLGVTPSVGGRLAFTLVGIALSLTGVLGVLNRAYWRNALWRR